MGATGVKIWAFTNVCQFDFSKRDSSSIRPSRRLVQRSFPAVFGLGKNVGEPRVGRGAIFFGPLNGSA